MIRTAASLVLACSSSALADSPRATPPPAPPATTTPAPEKKIRPAPPPPPSPPDPIVSVAQNANLESTARHQGLAFTLAGGGGITVGFGVRDAVGRGPSASLRFSHTAGERFAFTAEIASVTLLHRAAGTTQDGEVVEDQDTNLLLGLQFFVNRTLWVRLAGGIGDYRPSKGGNLAGPAGLFGAGLDVFRFRRIGIGLEMMSIGMLNRDGLLSSSAFMIAFNVE